MNEYILKRAAILTLTNEANIHNNPSKRAYERAAAIIKQITAEDVQPVKRGRWISQGNYMWLCSNCKENIIYSEHESNRTEKQRYCCKCGARMDGDTE